MKHWIFFISTLAVAYCRPQLTPQDSSAVEIEKQDVIEILSKTKQLDESTKQILAKIAQVNEKQGLNKKKPRPYQNLPFGYQRSEEHFNNRQGSDFKFPRDPFTNPILEYIERKGSDIEANLRTPTKENNAENEEIPFGHYIKRKITHQQTMVVPNRGYLPPNMVPTQQNLPQPFFPNPLQGGIKTDLEKQTVNNIKNIVENSRHPPFSSNYQPLFTPYGYPQPSQNFDGVYQLYGPYAPQSVDRPEKLRQWQWPLAEYFPIVIKDPVMHMFQAFTTMVEYGPQGSGNAGDACKKHGEAKQADVASPKAKKIDEKDKLSYSVTNNGKGAEITVTNDDNSNLTTVIDIEDLAITDNRESPLEMKLNYRQSKQDHDTAENQNSSLIDLLSNPLIQTVEITQQKLNDTSRESPPTRDQVLYEDEIFEDKKAENVQVSHSGTKKLVSKDNTGTGIFVHKIKVRKGGVAIAGPGGIATAGSGGTAIVGPNGFAYTHPDSLAIAGSGTKVVAVEPTISLSQVVADHNKNKTRGEGHTLPRLGKIVAVGPVIYYNKGYPLEETQSRVTLIPFYGGGKGQSLQIVERPDGTVLTFIIKTPPQNPPPSEEAINTSELENPPLPSRQDLDFGSNIRNIHQTAINIIKLQELAKKNGKLDQNQENLYQKNMEELNSSARNLAQLQEQEDFSFENREGLTEWFERKKNSKRDKDKDKKKKEDEDKKKEEEKKKKEEEEQKRKAEEEEKRKEEEEEKNKKEKEKEEEEEEGGEEEGDSDAISIGLPPEDASVAEAKPVGLAVAGEGGVAASKPIATAVVGPGGLAIARPVGTAIAGVAPDQALVPIYAEGYVGGTKPKRYGSTNKSDPTSELLNRIISKYHQN